MSSAPAPAPAPAAPAAAAAPAAVVEIESVDVVRLVLQFLRENGLAASFETLAAESGVALNTVDSLATFEAVSSDTRRVSWGAAAQ